MNFFVSQENIFIDLWYFVMKIKNICCVCHVTHYMIKVTNGESMMRATKEKFITILIMYITNNL